MNVDRQLTSYSEPNEVEVGLSDKPSFAGDLGLVTKPRYKLRLSMVPTLVFE